MYKAATKWTKYGFSVHFSPFFGKVKHLGSVKPELKQGFPMGVFSKRFFQVLSFFGNAHFFSILHIDTNFGS